MNLTTYFYCDKWLDATCGCRAILKPSYRTPLPEGLCRYVITVKTSDILYAGTDSNVHMRLHGSMEDDRAAGGGADHGGGGGSREVSTPLISLNNSRDNFERKQEDFFIVDAPDVGNMSSIVIGHDGRNFGAGWHLAEVRVENTSTERTGLSQYAVFKSGKWFDRTEPPRLLEQTIYAEGHGRAIGGDDGEGQSGGGAGVMTKGWGLQVTYTVLMYSSSFRSANVYLELEGEKGALPWTQVQSSKRNAHEKGGVDVFSISGSDVGAVTRMGVLHSFGKPWKCVFAEVINDHTAGRHRPRPHAH